MPLSSWKPKEYVELSTKITFFKSTPKILRSLMYIPSGVSKQSSL